MNPWDQFTGANAGYVYELFERYQRDPSSVDEATRRAFATWTPEDPTERSADGLTRGAAPSRQRVSDLQAGIAAFNLAESIRRFGHLAARLDPLGFHDPIGDPSLQPQSHGLTTRGAQAAAGVDRVGPRGSGRRAMPSRPSTGCATSTARPPATTTTTCSCPTSGCGCARRSSRASSGRPRIRSTAASCSIASPRSRRSSASCTARSRARRASRSKAST